MLSIRRFQFLAIAGVLFVALYFSYQLSTKLYDYLPLTAQAPARVLQWEVEEVKDKFALKALYVFEEQGNTWKSSHRLREPYYWNEPAAITAVKRVSKEDWCAWHDPKNPAHSALEKSFPAGLLFRTCICYGLLIYFFYFGRKVVLI